MQRGAKDKADLSHCTRSQPILQEAWQPGWLLQTPSQFRRGPGLRRLLHAFASAAVTKYHPRVAQSSRHLLSHLSGDQESSSKVLAGPCSLGNRQGADLCYLLAPGGVWPSLESLAYRCIIQSQRCQVSFLQSGSFCLASF